MNSLNILSAHVIGTTPKPIRSRSVSDGLRSKETLLDTPKRSASQYHLAKLAPEDVPEFQVGVKREDEGDKKPMDEVTKAQFDEKSPLLASFSTDVMETKESKRGSRLFIKRVFDALTETIKWMLKKLAAPGVFVASCFYDDRGHFSVATPIRRMRNKRTATKGGRHSTAQALGLSGSSESSDSDSYLSEKSTSRASLRRHSSTTPATSDSELDLRSSAKGLPRTRGQRSAEGESVTPRRSIRIKVNNEDSARRKKSRKSKTASDITQSGDATHEEAAAAELKSPTSPASSLRITKDPYAPFPPRPLIPRRQPSYSNQGPKQPGELAQKTLVLDLDETLIHSLAKGGRMSSGHMVEVKLSSPTAFNGLSVGPQHPILYYVHKRPYCDDFLKKVSKWYNLVVFTASVQEYADPVIDWLEQERKFFSARYYRQHCTFRNGAYIKDLSSVEPDLSKVMILDNSPLSYIFHEGRRDSSQLYLIE